MCHRKHLTTVVVSVVLIGILAMCFSTIVYAKKDWSGTKIEVSSIVGVRPFQPTKDMTPAFEDETGMDVIWREYSEDVYFGKLVMELSVNPRAWDVIQGWAAYLSAYEPYIISLNPYIERDYGSVAEFRKRFYPVSIDNMTFNGEVKFIPYHLNNCIVGYRKDLFEDPAEKEAFREKYGYELGVPKTYDQLRDIAVFFSRPEDNLTGYVLMGAGPQTAMQLTASMYCAGLELFNAETGEPPDREKTLSIFRFWYDLIEKDKAMPKRVVSLSHAETYEEYAAGLDAMFQGWVGDFWDKLNSTEVIERIGETGTFVLPGGKGPWVSNWGYAITKGCKDPEAAWEFIKFAVSKDVQLAQSALSGQNSPNIEFNKIEAERGYVPPASSEALAMAGHYPVDGATVKIFEAYATYLPRMLLGEITPEETYDTLAQEIRKTYQQYHK